MELLDRPSAIERPEERPHAAIVRDAQLALQRAFLFLRRHGRRPLRWLPHEPAVAAQLERPERLHEGFLERPPDRHRLADRLHLGRQRAVSAWELLERPARYLDDDVIDRRFEGRRSEPRDVVGDLVQRVAERQLGRDLGDRKARRLGGQRRRARHARIHLDDDDAAVLRVDRELDVQSAGLDADAADDPSREVAHALILAIGQRERGGDRDAVAGMHAHRIDVLDRADDDEVVGPVAHDLELELLPANHRLLEQHLVNRAHVDAAPGNLPEFLDVVRDAAADPTQREGRPDDARKTEDLDGRNGLLDRPHVAALRNVRADRSHGLAELEAVLRDLDGFDRCADELDAVLLQRPVLAESDREIEGRLPADRRKHRVRALAIDDLCQHFRRERLDVGPVGQLRIGHDRRRVAVDEDDLEPLGSEGLASLCA